jgi:SET domain-containing protein
MTHYLKKPFRQSLKTQTSSKKLTKRYGEFISLGSHEKRDRELYIIKHGSPEHGYGLFAKNLITKDSILGVYTGYASVRGRDQDTTFVTNFIDFIIDMEMFKILLIVDPTRVGVEYWMKKDKADVGIDARKFGNYMRFINQDKKRGCPYW